MTLSTEKRRDLPTVLVDQAEHTVGVGVIRSLGRAGYPVVACSPHPDPIGFHSRYTTHAVRSPRPFDRAAYLSWLDGTIAAYGVGAIIATEGLLTAIADRYDRYAHLLPYAGAESLYGALNKVDVMRRFGPGDPHVARHVVVDTDAPTPGLAHLTAPLFFKGDHLHAVAGAESQVRRAQTPAQIAEAMTVFRRRFRRFVVQGFEPGVGVGASYVRWDGRIVARLLHRRLHEVPPSGGVSSLRETFWDPAIAADAEARMEAMGWQGPVMFEYRWDPDTGAFRLIEVNARFWGSLHLGLFAGIDFPRLLVDSMRGARPMARVHYATRVRARETFPGEVDYVRLCLADDSQPIRGRLAALARVMIDTVDPRVHSDMSFPGDRGLALRRAWQDLRQRTGRRLEIRA